jgi:hypothetical protein
MGNVVDAIPFEGECYFYPILHHVTRLSSTFSSTSNSDSSINYSLIHLIYCNRARLDLRVQQRIQGAEQHISIVETTCMSLIALLYATTP